MNIEDPMLISRNRWLRAGLLSVAMAACVAGGPAWAQQAKEAERSRAIGKANKKTIEAFVVLLRLRHDLFLKWKETGVWPDDKEANQALAGHGQYWQKQLKDGRALLAGGMKGDYWDNVALIVFEAESASQAQQIVKDDPAVRAYVFQAQVRPFDVHFLTNKFDNAH